jgi:hypothetical protein
VDHVIELHDAMVKLGISLGDGNQQKSRAIMIILISTNSISELINYQQCYFYKNHNS